MAFPFTVGSLYYGGKVNGMGPIVWTQPGGPGTIVLPQFPRQYPQVAQGYPQSPFAYNGYYSFGCGHWANTIETFEAYNADAGQRSLMACCPMCSYIQQIVTPAALWYNDYFGLYPTGLGTEVFS